MEAQKTSSSSQNIQENATIEQEKLKHSLMQEENLLHLIECMLTSLIQFHRLGLVHSSISPFSVCYSAKRHVYMITQYDKFLDNLDFSRSDKDTFMRSNARIFLPPELKKKYLRKQLPIAYSLKFAEMHAVGITLLIARFQLGIEEQNKLMIK